MNANDAMLTALATAQRGSMVADTAPNAPANPSFDLVLEATGAPFADGKSAVRRTLISVHAPGERRVRSRR
jgi:hypothetical protein